MIKKYIYIICSILYYTLYIYIAYRTYVVCSIQYVAYRVSAQAWWGCIRSSHGPLGGILWVWSVGPKAQHITQGFDAFVNILKGSPHQIQGLHSSGYSARVETSPVQNCQSGELAFG